MAINLIPAKQAPEGYPHRDPNEIAQDYWLLHTQRDQAELFIGA